MGNELSASNVQVAIPVGKGFGNYRPNRVFRYGQWVTLHWWTDGEIDLIRREYKYNI